MLYIYSVTVLHGKIILCTKLVRACTSVFVRPCSSLCTKSLFEACLDTLFEGLYEKCQPCTRLVRRLVRRLYEPCTKLLGTAPPSVGHPCSEPCSASLFEPCSRSLCEICLTGSKVSNRLRTSPCASHVRLLLYCRGTLCEPCSELYLIELLFRAIQ